MFLNDSDMVECPYNKIHRMLRKRLQSHLLKCRVNYPDVELRKCPFNITHLIPEPEYTYHATNCPDRKLITQYKYDAPAPKEEDRPKHAPIECEENWDETNVNDYNPRLFLESANVIRQPEGSNPSERKLFIKKERKRLGDGDSSDDEIDNGGAIGKNTTRKEPVDAKLFISRTFSKETDQNRSRKRSISPTSSYKRSRSPANKYKEKHEHSPSGLNRLNRDYRNSDRRSPDYSLTDVSIERNPKSYNLDQDPYYNSAGISGASNFPFHRSNCDPNIKEEFEMPEAPPPPIISYPTPRSCLTSKKTSRPY